MTDVDRGFHVKEFDNAMVGAKSGLTINLGNFNSAQVSTSLTLPCHEDDIEAAHDFARKWVKAKTKAEADEITGSES